MLDHDVPDYAREAASRMTARLDELSTRTIRFRATAEHLATTLADHPRPDPAEMLRTAAQDRTAPVELVRVARAVREGRTTWQEIVDGKASSVPEFAAYQRHTNDQVRRLIESGALDLTRREEPPPAPPHVEEDEDEVEIKWVRR